jgi:hypothetical protein
MMTAMRAADKGFAAVDFLTTVSPVLCSVAVSGSQ